ncbi:sigma-70 family RNA polymerase sigma factor [Methylobacillus pratensis]
MGLPAYQEEHELMEWKEFLLHRSIKVRERLINRYEGFANILAAKLYSNRQVDEVEFEEYKQYALIGLIESVDRYDPGQGASFKTYASYRIKGAILNGIEKHNEKQQQITASARLKEERMQSLLHEATTAQPPGDDPFMRLVDIALGVAIGYMLEDSGMYQAGEEVQQSGVYKSRELQDLMRVVDALVGTLPEQEEKIIRLHYYQQMRFDHIAEKLNLSKGRISQLHHRALQRLYEHYDELKLLRTEY